ncbi:hypothetical protein FRC01_001498 [Tulasnella sp. 417]|nr:hypothetical protein FRC01_001498 [Tulasnella sp. 417]
MALIDLKNAAEGLIRNYPSLPSSVLCDALAKASVDDQGGIVLTPEIDGPPHNFDESVEQLVQTAWSEFLRAGKYRELRRLGAALAGDPKAILGKCPREFKTSAAASQYLQQFWVSHSRRWLPWPSEIKGTFEPGDLGVFEVQPGRGRIFRKLESASTELGGIMTKVNSSDFEEVQPGVYRATCNPLKEGDHVKPSLDSFILSWSNRLKDAQTERDWLCANANRLAATHGVASEDLVLLTKTMHGLDVKPLERLSRRIQKPIYLYVHISDNGTAFKRYWTFQDSPTLVGSQQEAPRNSEISGLPLPDVEMLASLYFGDRPYPTRYLQLEVGEI